MGHWGSTGMRTISHCRWTGRRVVFISSSDESVVELTYGLTHVRHLLAVRICRPGIPPLHSGHRG